MAVRCAKTDHIQSVLDAAGTNSWEMFSVVNSLLGKDSASLILPELDDQCVPSLRRRFRPSPSEQDLKRRRILPSIGPLILLVRLCQEF